MTPDVVFVIVNVFALLSWLLLMVLPHRRWIVHSVTAVGTPALLAAVYTGLVASHWSGSSGGFSTLASVADLFANPWMLLAGWVHYLCFDLLVGCWEVHDARERGVPHVLVIPCLALTFLFGPTGWLCYQGLRSAYPRPV